ncbi:MAG: protein translocase subunit SecF [Deltaproteobacteria bacterium]|nr:MAG: protein translocase subunit SecF [Deltaproteobacteria bacterium]
MELIKPGTTIDFVRYSKWALVFSVLLVLLGLASLWYHGGPNYGVDFVGGTVVQVKFTQPTSIADIRQALAAANIANITVQDFGQGGNEFLIRIPVTEAGTEGLSGQIQQGLAGKFGEQAFEVRRLETVGPKVGKDLRRKAMLAVLFSTVMMGVYIAFRFEPRFGVGAAVALLHDVLITAGALSMTNMEFDLTVVAALLTVVGFSVNDTVIVCDRIRENMRKLRRDSLTAIINRSINETLSRTIITTGTAVLVIIALLFLGGEVIHAFAFALLVGFTIGTYSSIYVASPIVLLWEKEGKRR